MAALGRLLLFTLWKLTPDEWRLCDAKRNFVTSDHIWRLPANAGRLMQADFSTDIKILLFFLCQLNQGSETLIPSERGQEVVMLREEAVVGESPVN